ncbi:RNA polymerase sigma factor, sigma-70 family [Salegentibacter echinorum]|uniref:RNA polymerase sigma factor, sigma-70 family n=2 Tax=Salegentibacter echinorum TaxID=1073325 RepID=A0A1M5JQE6_SALEC|nr:RNA polymerase sigma factor, sigma-70 family [Salegentibacter echinorum]
MAIRITSKDEFNGHFDRLDQSEKHETAELSHKENSKSSIVWQNAELKEKLAARIWGELKGGNVESLGELYDLYIEELYAYGMEKNQNKNKVMDAIHDLFVDLYKYRTNIVAPSNVKYYLLRSLKRKIFKKALFKRHVKLKEHFLETKNDETSLTCEEQIIEAEYSKEKKDKLKAALVFLTKRQQKAIHLRYTENRPYDEIAETMNISIATSRTLVYRALSALRKHCLPFTLLIFKILL